MTQELTCTACGGELEWSPARQGVVCSHCAAPSEMARPSAGEVERRAVTVEALTQGRAYGVETSAFQCGRCGATIDLAPHIALTQCAFCGSDQLRDYSDEDPMKPDGIVPFRLDREAVEDRMREWAGDDPQTPGDVAEQLELTSAQGVYLPAWIFRARANGAWECTVEIPQRKDSWRKEPRAGAYDREFIDRLVFASSYADGLTDFFYDTRQIVPYDPRYLAGFPAERAQRAVADAWMGCKEQFAGEYRDECEQEGAAACVAEHGHVVETSVDPRWSGENYFLCLVPTWFATYTYRGEPHRAVVNGLTGECTGDLPADAGKAWLYGKIGRPGTPERRKALGAAFFVGVFALFFLFVAILMATNE